MKCWKLKIDGDVSYFNNLSMALAIAKTYKNIGAKKITLKWGDLSC